MSKRVLLQKLGNESVNTATEQIKVGGPFVDDCVKDPSSCSRRPIITPPLKFRSKPLAASLDLKGDARSTGKSAAFQYLLIPERDRIQVLSMEHGGTVLSLIPQQDTTTCQGAASTIVGVVHIRSVDIVRGQEEDEWMVIAGCSNGLLLEWSLNVIHEMSIQGGTYNLSKSYIQTPRRMFHIAANTITTHESCVNDKQEEGQSLIIQGDITHLSSPPSEPLLVYALIRPYTKNTTENAAHFVRISLPPWSGPMNEQQGFTFSSSTGIYPIFITSFVKETKQGRTKSKIPLLSHSSAHDTLTLAVQTPPTDACIPSTYSFSNYSKNIVLLPFLPILLLSGVNVNRHPFAVVVQPRGFTYFCDQRYVNTYDANRLIHFKRPSKINSRITAASISPDSEDLALAFTDGKIDVYTSITSRTARFVESKTLNDVDMVQNVQMEDQPRKHPGAETLIQTFHWHSLPVHSLCYLGSGSTAGASNLLSGGEESVLVTWNLEQGVTKPSHTLPRLSKGSISHIVTNKYSSSMDIVVCCMDNTLQLIRLHNYITKWRIQGLATALNEPIRAAVPKESDPILSTLTPILALDPRTKYPILSRLAGAPGVVHWFDIITGRVVGELEIAPYNRVSRKEVNHLAYPRPVITHLVISGSGDDIVTIDKMLTENPNVGAIRTVSHGGNSQSEMSLTTNIKFWAWSKSLEETSGRGLSMPYDMIAAMHSPHGLLGQVDALALSSLGNKACTFSAHDGTFHIWNKERTQLHGDKKQVPTSSTTPPTPPWKRLYKISAPAGYANAHPGRDIRGSNIAFSADGSLLAVAYGKNVTLWDHSSATMLHSIVAHDALSDIEFIKSPADMLLAMGNSFISSLPLFGSLYLGGGIWSYALNDRKNTEETIRIELGPAIPLSSNRDIAIVLLEKSVSKPSANILSSKVVIIDSHSGEPRMIKKSHPLFWDVPGSITSICDISSKTAGNISLLVITGTGEMIALNTEFAPELHEVDIDVVTTRQVPYFEVARSSEKNNNAPTLPALKKQRLNDTHANFKSQMSGFASFLSSFPASTAELPVLSHCQFINTVTKIISE